MVGRGIGRPIGMIHINIGTQQLLFPCFVGIVPSDKITIFLGLEERDEVNSAPHLFANKFTAATKS